MAGSDSTFEQLWKRILVYAPNTPIPLAQEFINTAYSRMLAASRWSSLRKYNEFFIPDPYNTGTINLTQDGTTVTGVGTVWTASMVGRQFIIGSQAPFYDITAVDVGAQTLTISRPYVNTTLTNATYSIEYTYIQMPSDFLELLIVRDINLNWRLRLDIPQEQLDTWDAKRTVTGTGWVLAPAAPWSDGTIRYELWPRLVSNKRFTYTYISKPALMSANSDKPIYPIRGDVIREGALSELALWPGLDGLPNPYYNMDAHRIHEMRFWEKVFAVEREDQEIRQSNIMSTDFETIPWAPIDASYIQSHDVF